MVEVKLELTMLWALVNKMEGKMQTTESSHGANMSATSDLSKDKRKVVKIMEHSDFRRSTPKLPTK